MNIPTRKAREFNRREHDILDAALSLFQSDAWESVTVEQIAQQAGVAKGTIYKHFASKSEIYARLAIQFRRETLVRLPSACTGQPVIERLKDCLRCAWQTHLSSQELHRVFLFCSRDEFQASLPASILAEMQEVDLQTNQLMYSLLEQGIEQGIFPKKPIALLLFGVQSAFWGAIQLIWSGYSVEYDRELYLDELINFVLAGLIYQNHPIS